MPRFNPEWIDCALYCKQWWSITGNNLALFRAWNIFGTLTRLIAFLRTRESTTRSNDRDVDIRACIDRSFTNRLARRVEWMKASCRLLEGVPFRGLRDDDRMRVETTSCEENNAAHELTEEHSFTSQMNKLYITWKSINV